MTHFRKFYDSDYVGSWDIKGHRDVVVEIKSVVPHKMKSREKGEKPKSKLLIHFVGSKTNKGFVCGVKNAKLIAALHGEDIEGWPGKTVAMYVEKQDVFGQMLDVICIRAEVPRGSAKEIEPATPPHNPETGEVPGDAHDNKPEPESDPVSY